MTDLVFLLLIFFIVISTLITAGVNIDVPKNGGSSSDKKILEVNLNHKIMKNLKEKMKDENKLSQCVDVTLLLHDTALINSGFMLDKPSIFANKVNRMVELGFCDDDGDDDDDCDDTLPELVDDDDVDDDMEKVD